MQTELFQNVSHKKILQYLFTGIVRALQSNRQICFKIADTLTGINNLHYIGYYTTEINKCQGVDEIAIPIFRYGLIVDTFFAPLCTLSR